MKSQFDETVATFSVQRRFSDFLWLHDALARCCCGVIIPPLPPKQLLGRLDEYFVQRRMRGLNDFIAQVVAHPILSQQVFVLSFLQVEDIDQAHRDSEICGPRQKSQTDVVMFWFTTKLNFISVDTEEVLFCCFIIFSLILILCVVVDNFSDRSHGAKSSPNPRTCE